MLAIAGGCDLYFGAPHGHGPHLDGQVVPDRPDSFAGPDSPQHDANSGWSTSATRFSISRRPVSVAIADVNGDGRPDVTTANFYSDSVSVVVATTVPGDTSAAFGSIDELAVGSGPASIVVADVNGDGRPDLVTANNADISVLLNTTAPGAATPAFAAHVDFARPPLYGACNGMCGAATVSDINWDGKPDVIVADRGVGKVSVFVNTTPSASTVPSFDRIDLPESTHWPIATAVGDFDRDGTIDVAAADSGNPGSFSIFSSTSAPGAAVPTFADPVMFTASDAAFVFIASGDLDGDGKPDLVMVDSYLEAVIYRNITPAGASAPDFAAPAGIANDGSVESFGLGDLDGDGKLDLVLPILDRGDVCVRFNRTLGSSSAPTFDPCLDFVTGQGPWAVAFGDLNSDGKLDFVVASPNFPSMQDDGSITAFVTQ